MASFSPDEVRRVALLARLELTDAETEKFATELSSILSYVDQLKELDTNHVPATSHSLKLENVFREDVPEGSLSRDDVLANAPEQEDGYFKVPAVIQDGGGA